MYFTANQVAGASNTVNLTSLTVVENRAKTAGGGLYLALNQLAGATITANVDNNIFDNNTTAGAGGRHPSERWVATWKETFNLVGTNNGYSRTTVTS